MRTTMMLAGAIILVLLLAAFIVGLDDARMDEFEELHNVTTGAGANTSVITLTQELFNDETRHVSISSNLTSDAPVPSNYATATQKLTVGGLTTDSSRQLTVTYQTDGLGEYYGIGTALKVFPMLLGLGIIGLIAAAMYQGVSGRDE